ncbi:hypothetical protein OUZ56_021463 [Daphnia magna]|uniref:Uncharacterized protein n=1 Tax=Daphnia magna TaxID=35525 RepID=A0ABQ9ZHF6_9CRUS|nr:hypothetical protein OUZ56_021463 [Daphnia magna]
MTGYGTLPMMGLLVQESVSSYHSKRLALYLKLGNHAVLDMHDERNCVTPYDAIKVGFSILAQLTPSVSPKKNPLYESGNYGGILLLAVALLMATLITGVMMGSSPSYTIDTPYYAYPRISRIH